MRQMVPFSFFGAVDYCNNVYSKKLDQRIKQVNRVALFGDLAKRTNGDAKAHRHDPNAPTRVLTSNRLQIELHPSNLESLLPEGHHVRRD